MAVYKRGGSGVYRCEFEYKGQRYQESTGCTTKQAAQAWEVRRREQVRQDHDMQRQGVKRMLLVDLATKWLAASETMHRDHKNNQSRVRKLFGAGLVLQGQEWVEVPGIRKGLPSDLQVHELTQGHLSTLRAQRIHEGNSPATINREFALVQSLLGYAASLNVVLPAVPIVWSNKRNRVASLKLQEPRGKLRWLRVHEETLLLRTLAETADKRPGDDAARDAHELTLVLLDTGARYEEAAALPWAAIDLDAGTLDLYRSKVDNESVLVLPQRTLQVLRARRKRMSARGLLCSFVFPAIKGRRWAGEDAPRGHATGSIQLHIDRCGLNNTQTRDGRVTPHTFRHTFASRLLQAGVSLSKVSKLLGHANEATTQIYAHLCPEATGAEASSVLDRLHEMVVANKRTQGDGPVAPASFPSYSVGVSGWFMPQYGAMKTVTG